MKATSQVGLFKDPKVKAGVVYYAAGELSFFPEDTAIQPDNPHPIAHTEIAQCYAAGTFSVLGKMPDSFRDSMTVAIKASITMKPIRKQHFMERL